MNVVGPQMIVDGKPNPHDQKMDPTLKKTWLEALRSGRYIQGQHRLKRNGEHCCLGVLCELAGLEESVLDHQWDGATTYFAYGDDKSNQVLPKPFAEKVGITDMRGKDLMLLNDSGQSFRQIADWIETML